MNQQYYIKLIHNMTLLLSGNILYHINLLLTIGGHLNFSIKISRSLAIL